MCVAFIFERNMRMVATVELERFVTHTAIVGVVVGKLHHQKEPCPVILLSIYKGMKVCFHGAILAFRLFIGLRVECGGELSFDVEEVTERGPKLGYKNRSSVTYNRVQKAVMSYHLVYNYFRWSRSINGDFDWFVVHHFGQPVNNDQNEVVAVAFPVRRQR